MAYLLGFDIKEIGTFKYSPILSFSLGNSEQNCQLKSATLKTDF